MIRLKAMRLKGVNSAALAGPGSTSVTDRDAEMYFFPRDEYVAAKRRTGKRDEYIIPTADIAFMQPMEPMDCFPAEATLVTTVPDSVTMPPEQQAPPVDDTSRMVKIDGKIVERRGEPQEDELEALTAPKRSIFDSSGDEEEEDTDLDDPTNGQR